MKSWTLKRRKDVVVKEQNARALVAWLLANEKLLARYLEPEAIGRLNKRLKSAADKDTDEDCHSSASKAIMQHISRDTWELIRGRFYKDRDASRSKFTTVMLTQDIRRRLAELKTAEGYESYSETVDALLTFRAEKSSESAG